jgi:hypothetical protein
VAVVRVARVVAVRRTVVAAAAVRVVIKKTR